MYFTFGDVKWKKCRKKVHVGIVNVARWSNYSHRNEITFPADQQRKITFENVEAQANGQVREGILSPDVNVVKHKREQEQPKYKRTEFMRCVSLRTLSTTKSQRSKDLSIVLALLIDLFQSASGVILPKPRMDLTEISY